MSATEEKIFDHVLNLHPGEAAEIDLRFAMDQGTSIAVILASVDPAARTAELVIDDMWSGYRMEQFVEESGRWMPIWPEDDADVHAVVRFGAGSLLSISSDLAFQHSLDLTEVAWNGATLRLTIVETG
jgi:hypothetical protein